MKELENRLMYGSFAISHLSEFREKLFDFLGIKKKE